MSGTDQNWVRDRTGYDINRFVWAGMPGIEGGAKGVVGFTTVPLSTDQNDWNPTENQVTFGANAAIRAAPSVANVNITGMVAYIGGELKAIINTSATNFITLKSLSGLSQPGNQFFLGSDVVLAPGNSVQVWYDPIDQNWKLLSLRGGVQSAMPIFANGGAIPLPAGILGWLEVPANATITGWKIMSTEVCSVTIDLWKVPFASWPPTVANTITGTAVPAIANAKSAASAALTGWTTSLTQGDIVLYNLSATDGRAIRLMFSLDVTRTQ